MHRAKIYIGSLFLVGALGMPVAIKAVPVPQENREHRVYDREHKDYHNWNDREDRAWGQFQTENHRNSHEFKKSNRKEQSEYWKWRHEHPDKD